MEQIQEEYENVIKRVVGRPTKHFELKNDAEYFKKYYHLTKTDALCECGAIVNSKCLAKHMKRERHTRAMILKAKLNI